MDAVVLALLAGLAVGVVATVVGQAWLRRRQDTGQRGSEPRLLRAHLTAEPPSSGDVLGALPVAVAVLDRRDDVVLANRTAVDIGVVRGPLLLVAEVHRLVQEARADGARREAQVEMPATRLGRGPEAVRVRVAPVGGAGHVAVLVEDVTEARRVEAVRRDFVANVSHELKTPVGAMALLAEALGDAADDPDAVRRFTGRLRAEAERLSRLVQELLSLSRLQGADPLPEQDTVSVDRVVAEAVDRARTLAAAAAIDLVPTGRTGLTVRGSEPQLVTAVGNLIENAVCYSPAGSRVTIDVRLRESAVEVSVRDQGIGIAEPDLERVFERFYRADPARSRATGGTGLGLAIVKHVATNHGGEVRVHSVEGAGSTFTLRLPPARRVERETA